MTVDFWKFLLSPVTSPKELRMLANVRISSCNGATKRAASSAYMEIRKCGLLPLSLLRAPISIANFIILCKGSIAMTKSSSDRGSPCRRPLPWRIGGLGTPFRRRREVEVGNSAAIQSLQRCGKPRCWSRCWSRLRRYSHRTESNALVMSSFRNKAGVLFL